MNLAISDRLASQTFHTFADDVPVDPRVIAERMNIRVIEANFANTTLRGFEGLSYIENNQRVILINSEQPAARKRFTIAHELGHHVLGHTESGHMFRDKAPDMNPYGAPPQEREANSFAASLLMPPEVVHELVVELGNSELSYLAKCFQVSEQAMSIRLKTLGYL